MTTVKSEKRVATYHGIENLFTPDVFFNLMGWTDRECHTEKARYSISNFHYAVSEKLSSVFGTEKFSNITKAITSFGVLSLAKFYNVMDEQVEKIIEDSYDRGFELLKKELEYICSCKNVKSSKTKERLLNVAKLYGNNKYSNVLRLILNTDVDNHSENKKIINIGNESFNAICEKELNDNMYKLKRNSENYGIVTYVSKMIGHINNKIKHNYRKNETKSEMYRGAYITGLYIISKWIHGGTLQNYNEWYSASLISDIKDVVYSNRDNG